MKKVIIPSGVIFFMLFMVSVYGGDKLKTGMNAPDFTLHNAYGKTYTLSTFKGKTPVIVYFYPKAGTPGCTIEACGIRDSWHKFEESKIPVLGVSVDGKTAIKNFIDKYHLNFPLLSDSLKNVSKEYGVLNKYGVDNRVTFIIDKEGKIANIIKVSDIDGHAAEVFKLASELK